MILHHPHTPRGSRFPRCLAVLIVFTFFSVLMFAAKAQEPDDVVRIRTDLVAIPVVVTDAHGRRVPGLKAEDFALTTDNGSAKINYFASGTDRVAILFALDTSGSARETIVQQRKAAAALYSHFGRDSRVAVLRFGDLVQLTVPFTRNAGAAQAAFNFEAKQNSRTAIFDAAATAVRAFDGGGGFSTERRIVVQMSDGLDTLSSTKYQDVIDAARRRGVSFYVIHFPLFSPREGKLEPRPAVKGFRELAEQTGGRYFRIGDAKSALDPHAHYELAPVFKAIEDDLRAQYVVGFYPGDASRDSHFHRVAVSLVARDRRKLRVRQFVEGYDLKP